VTHSYLLLSNLLLVNLLIAMFNRTVRGYAFGLLVSPRLNEKFINTHHRHIDTRIHTRTHARTHTHTQLLLLLLLSYVRGSTWRCRSRP
jgi:membrane-associated PAP2 superfamily phosphatase